MKKFMLKLPQKLHIKLKLFCVENDIFMTDFIIIAIQEKLEREKEASK